MLFNALVCLAALFTNEVSALKSQIPKGVVAYWGQNIGGGEQRLRHTCDRVDTVVLSYIANFPEMKLDFGQQCYTTFPSGLLHCPDIAEDIRYCQRNGKTILLSLGGDKGDYGFNDDDDAKAFAHVLYDTFGPGHTQDRPFDSVVVNGFDLSMTKGTEGYVALAEELNNLYQDSTDPFYLTASPSCYFPDRNLGDVLKSSYLSAVFVKFYDNWCDLDGAHFNYQTDWNNYATSMSANNGISIYVGLPGNRNAATSGYADINEVKHKVDSYILNDRNFGGISLYDASSAENNKNAQGISFDSQIKTFLNNPTFLGSHNNATVDQPLMKKDSRFAIKPNK